MLTFLDPVPDLLEGNTITRNPEVLATGGIPVTGVAADGVARVVIRIAANSVGEHWTVTLINDNGQPSTSTEEDGVLTTLDESGTTPPTSNSLASPGSAASVRPSESSGAGEVQVTAVRTDQGPMGFVLYQAPVDFSRNGRDDQAQQRGVSIRAISQDVPDSRSEDSLNIFRCPVVLVHGLWGSPSDWDTFSGIVDDSLLDVSRAHYDDNLPPPIASSDPDYPVARLAHVPGNALGLDFNAPVVTVQITKALNDFRLLKNAAIAQADIVAHSMGGVVTRTLINLPKTFSPESYGLGTVHKLVTIGTPHLGTPLATDLTGSSCVRKTMAMVGRFALTRVYLTSGEIVSGGAGDLNGDGLGGSISAALDRIQAGAFKVPTSMIAGAMSSDNILNGTGLVFHLMCKPFNDPLAPRLSPAGWPLLFGTSDPGNSDAIVPVTSQLDQKAGTIVSGVIHSSGVAGLGFANPNELDADSKTGIPTLVFKLLNQSVKVGFVALP